MYIKKFFIPRSPFSAFNEFISEYGYEFNEPTRPTSGTEGFSLAQITYRKGPILTASRCCDIGTYSNLTDEAGFRTMHNAVPHEWLHGKKGIVYALIGDIDVQIKPAELGAILDITAGLSDMINAPDHVRASYRDGLKDIAESLAADADLARKDTCVLDPAQFTGEELSAMDTLKSMIRKVEYLERRKFLQDNRCLMQATIFLNQNYHLDLRGYSPDKTDAAVFCRNVVGESYFHPYRRDDVVGSSGAFVADLIPS